MSAQSIATTQTLASALSTTTDLSTLNTLSGAQLYSSLYSSVSLAAAGSLSAHNATLPTTATTLKGDTLIASASNVTLLAGAGKDSLYAAVAGDWLVPSNSGSSLVSATNASFLASASSLGGWGTMVGGGAADTLVVSGVATANDLFSKTSGIEVLSLTGGSNVTLSTNAKNAGIAKVFGGNGGSTLTQATGDILSTTFVGGTGNDLFSIASSTLLGNDSIVGGLGRDTLALAASATLTDANLAKVSGIEVLSLYGTSSIVLGANAAANGITTVYGGATKNTLTQTSDDTLAMMLLGGAGTDLFSVTASQLSQDTISGGGGKDTLVLSTADTISDSAFSKVSGVQVVSLTSSSNVTIGTNAAAAGISLVSAGASGDTLNQTAVFTAISLAGGNGADYFSMTSGILSQAGETINGGSGTNTLALTDSGAAVADAAFINDKTIQALVLGSNSSVVLDAKAKGAGIASVFGASGGATISQTAGDTNVTTIVGGSGNDSIAITSGVLTKTSAATNDSIIGGGGVDTLSFNDTKAAAIADAAFSRVKGMSVLALNGDSLTVGANARSAGFSTIIAGATGSITHTVADTTALTLIGGSATGSTLGNAFFESTSAVLAADSIAGGAGTDTLVISSQGIFNDASFSRVRGVEVLSLTGASQINAGSALKAAGINTVLGGTGGDTFTQATGEVFTLNGGAGADSFEVTATALRADSIAGGSGTDTLALTSAATIADSDFAKVSGVEVLQLTSSSTVTLDTNVAASGIKTIYAGNNGDVIKQTASLSGAATIIGGSGNDLVSVATQAIFVADSLYGGKGIDTLVIADSAAAIVDTNFSKTKGFEVLSLNGGTATLGVGAAAEGFTTIKISGAAGETLNAATFNGDQHIIDDTASTGSDSLVGSSSTGTSFLVTSANLLHSTFVGGSGADTLSVANNSVISDSKFANVTKFDVLQLGSSSSVTLDSASTTAGFSRVVAGANDVVTDNVGFTAAGNRLIGTVNDTLAIGTAADFQDSNIAALYANVTGFAALSLSGGSNVTLGSAAKSAGISTLIGGSDAANSYTESASSLSAFQIYGGNGDGGDTLNITGNLISNDDFSALHNVAALQLDNGTNSVTIGSAAAAAGIQTIFGGTGNNNFVEASLGGIAIAGTSDSLHTTSLTLSGASSLDDSLFAALSRVQSLQLTGASAVTLGANADASGLVSITGGKDDSSVTQSNYSANGYFINLSADNIASGGGNTIYVDQYAQLSIDTIIGGTVGVDTLNLGDDTFTDDAFTNVSNVTIVQMAGPSATGEIDLGAAADVAGIQSLVGTGGNVTFNQTGFSGNSYTFDGSQDASNLFEFYSSSQLAGDLVLGGGGVDTLQVAEDNITDDVFNNASNISVLQLTDNSSVVIGGSADAAGLSSVYGGAGDSTIVQDISSTNPYYFDVSGGGLLGNTFAVATAAQMANDTFVGSLVSDTLQVGQDTIADNSFANVSLTAGTGAALQLTGSSSVTLGSNADASGIVSIYGGGGDSTIAQGSTSSDTISYTLVGTGDSSNLFITNDSTQASNDKIIGSGTGNDTLQIGEDNISDSTFANITGIAVLQLSGDSGVTLGGAADNSGIQTISGSGGNDTFAQTSDSSNGYYFDGSNDTTNFFVVDNEGLAYYDTFAGSGGGDTLQINNGPIDDYAFANVTGISYLQLNDAAGDTAVNLSTFADYSGIQTVIGGGGNDTFSQDSGSTGTYLFDGSVNTSNLFAIDNATLASADTFIGGTGSDSFELAQNIITDSDLSLALTNATGINSIQLADGGTSISLGSGAQSNKITSLTDGFDNDTVDLSGWNATSQNAAFTLNGGAGADNFILGSSSGNAFGNGAGAGLNADVLTINNFTASDTLTIWGHGGTDTGAGFPDYTLNTIAGGAQLINASNSDVIATIHGTITSSNINFI